MQTISANPGRLPYGGQPLIPRAAAFIIEAVGCSYRQLDRWAGDGLFGEEIQFVGQGARRVWTSQHAEMAWAITSLQRLGAGLPAWRVAADVVAARPVNPDGEILVVDLTPSAYRFDHWCGIPAELAAGVCVIPLRSFAVGNPTTDDGDSPAAPQPAGERGAAVSAAAAPISP